MNGPSAHPWRKVPYLLEAAIAWSGFGLTTNTWRVLDLGLHCSVGVVEFLGVNITPLITPEISNEG